VTTKFATKDEMVAYREKVWAENMYTFGGFRFLWVTGQVWVGDTECRRLSEIEADVLHALIKAWPKPLTSRALKAALSVETDSAAEDMKTWIRRIRKKVGLQGIILAAPGWGYTFNSEVLV
jgi:hypothetical protein